MPCRRPQSSVTPRGPPPWLRRSARAGVDSLQSTMDDLVGSNHLRPIDGGGTDWRTPSLTPSSPTWPTGSLTRRERSAHHQAVAAWHARSIGDPETSPRAAMVAHHFEQAVRLRPQAADTEKARLSELAAEAGPGVPLSMRPTWMSSARRGLAQAAIDLTEDGSVAESPRLIRLGRYLVTSGNLGEATVAFRKARAAAQGFGDVEMQHSLRRTWAPRSRTSGMAARAGQ